jgi:alkanesulfonate monooxygenase SsuD/methylene tetrahydromethanopterin reductase-like flavin-dependent oxidoreductase (luciferase family)
MCALKFGWHIHSFPVDGRSGPVFIDQIHQTLQRIHPHIDSVWNLSGGTATTEAAARRIAEASPYNSNAITGAPEQVAQQLQVFIDLGVAYLIVRVLDFPATTGVDLFVQDVMPRLRAAQGC